MTLVKQEIEHLKGQLLEAQRRVVARDVSLRDLEQQVLDRRHTGIPKGPRSSRASAAARVESSSKSSSVSHCSDNEDAIFW